MSTLEADTRSAVSGNHRHEGVEVALDTVWASDDRVDH